MHVDVLKEITVTLSADAEPERRGRTPRQTELRFIFGIGSQGLTPFEYLLNGRGVGETVRFRLGPGEWAGFFAHLSPHLGSLVGGPNEGRFNARVERVETADGRAVVKAMAASVAHGGGGCGGGCGCGCG